MYKGPMLNAAGSNDFFDRIFSRQQVMAILRGLSPAKTVEICELSWQAGIDVVEVPVQSQSAFASLDAAAQAAKRRGKLLGVGTVTTLEQLRQATRAGAAFTVAPGFDSEIATASLDAGLAHLPGVATATEVQQAAALGFRWLKAFPAAQLSAPWFSAMLAPFPLTCFVATGGVDAHNAPDFLKAGARVVGVGSALNDPVQLDRLAALQGPSGGIA